MKSLPRAFQDLKKSLFERNPWYVSAAAALASWLGLGASIPLIILLFWEDQYEIAYGLLTAALLFHTVANHGPGLYALALYPRHRKLYGPIQTAFAHQTAGWIGGLAITAVALVGFTESPWDFWAAGYVIGLAFFFLTCGAFLPGGAPAVFALLVWRQHRKTPLGLTSWILWTVGAGIAQALSIVVGSFLGVA